MMSLLLSSFLMAASPCGNKLQAFVVYEDLEKGKIVERHSLFNLMEWSDSSAFDGVVAPASSGSDLKLTFEVRPSLRSKAGNSWDFSFVPWSRDSKYLVAQNFSPAPLIGESAGIFTITLKNGKNIVCQETHGISSEGSND
ncbi:MAG: hypothetical protein KF789_00840 [Bdellovibrionaceae bacterium]|nr:hypothetical protein [Pseudobdellovibrionaceae bacterium]